MNLEYSDLKAMRRSANSFPLFPSVYTCVIEIPRPASSRYRKGRGWFFGGVGIGEAGSWKFSRDLEPGESNTSDIHEFRPNARNNGKRSGSVNNWPTNFLAILCIGFCN